MKVCRHCEIAKAEYEFTKNAAEEDGLNVRCRSCQKKYRIERGLQKPEGWKRKTADWAGYQRAWAAKHPGYAAKMKKRWLKKNKKRDLCLQKYKYALRTGALVRGVCFVCGTSNEIHGHHADYDEALNVTWLCREHHLETHGKTPRNGKLA